MFIKIYASTVDIKEYMKLIQVEPSNIELISNSKHIIEWLICAEYIIYFPEVRGLIR